MLQIVIACLVASLKMRRKKVVSDRLTLRGQFSKASEEKQQYSPCTPLLLDCFNHFSFSSSSFKQSSSPHIIPPASQFTDPFPLYIYRRHRTLLHLICLTSHSPSTIFLLLLFSERPSPCRMSMATEALSSVPKEPSIAARSLAELGEMEFKIANDRRAVQEKDGDDKESSGLRSDRCKGLEADATRSLKEQTGKEKVQETPLFPPPPLPLISFTSTDNQFFFPFFQVRAGF